MLAADSTQAAFMADISGQVPGETHEEDKPETGSEETVAAPNDGDC